ncbi:MAG: MMPL family transporter, partial [Actinomycetales bacterium]
ALASVAGGLFALLGFSHLLQLDPSVASVTTVMGLGLSIDYALLLVSRFREERSRGYDAQESLARMMATAGRTILFSALTVAVSLSGLFFFDVIVYKGLAAAGLSVVVFALLAALTLVPALIAVFAKRIKPTRASGADDGFFARLARTTQRRPIPVVVAVALVVLIAGTPFLGAHYRLGGVELLPTDSEARQFSDLIDARFPQSAADPLLVVAHVPASQLAAYTTEVTQRPDVAPHLRAVLPPQDRLHGWSSLAVIAKGDPQGEDAQALVHALREHRPAFRTWVTGNGAVLVDLSAQVAAGVWKAALWVGLATFVLLFLMTGSVLVPLKALVMNTLSLGATFGALIWIFQEGHLSGLLGFTPVGGLETWLPVMVFAFAFGLSMDYEVFLLSRIKELYDSGLPNDRAVELGLQRTGRIITSAALLVVIVFAGFAAGRTMTIKEIGVALAIAVAVDATLVRCLLVPATMTLLGDLNWWAPGPLRRLHARIGLREHTDLPAPRAPEAAAPPTRSTVA